MDQLCYEDVREGMELPTAERTPTTRTLVMWAAASGDYYELHFDKDFAQSQGFPGPVVHGRLGAAFLGQFLTDWIGEKGEVREITVQYRGSAFPGGKLTLGGRAIRKYVEGGENLVECDIWIINPEGKQITAGRAVVALPSAKPI